MVKKSLMKQTKMGVKKSVVSPVAKDSRRLADFFFEVGTMRKLPRMHRQTLLTEDVSDTIASHSYRVTIIGWWLAKMEKADPYKTVMMCLFHDMGEVRTGDHNWIHKRYISIHDDEIIEEQLGSLPDPELKKLALEYQERQSRESIIAKDADLLDQILLLREYEWQGNREASIWLRGKESAQKEANAGNHQAAKLKTASGVALANEIYTQDPSAWWNNLWTSNNRK